MIKILGIDEVNQYKNLFKILSESVEGVNYIIDCPWIYDNAKIKSTDIILDVGCGAGGMLYYTAQKCKEAYGIDVVDYTDGFKIRKKRYNINNLQFVLGNATKMPFEDNFFDIITAVSAIEHNTLEELNILMKECGRILKPGGRLIATGATGHGYWDSEEDIRNACTTNTQLKIEDETTLTNWDRTQALIKLKELKADLGDKWPQDWIPVGVILKK